MAKDVKNWQLGRLVKYEHEEARPERQWAIVVNLNRCLGCQSCTMACKNTWCFSKGQEHMWWNNVESKPFGGYPQGWDLKTLKLLEQVVTTKLRDVGKTVYEAAYYAERRGARVLGYIPVDSEWKYPNYAEDVPSGAYPEKTSWVELPEHQSWFFHLPRTCNHCTYPACLAACPRNAIYKRPEDGLVLIDQKRCRGYRKCISACPYKKVMYRGVTGKSESCIGCYPRVENGEVAMCVSACPGKARLQGWVDDEDSPVHYMVHKEKVALPLYPQFGTEPNVYYIPPRWVNRKYLSQMFSNYDISLINEALSKYIKPSQETLGVLRLFGITRKIISSYKVGKDTVESYDENEELIVSVPFKESLVERSGDYHNIT